MLVPIVGMLCGNTLSGVSVSLTYILKELEYVLPLIPSHSSASLILGSLSSENRDKTETYLAFGASRLEACKPIVKEALRLALTPTINQMRCVSFTSASTLLDH